MILATHWNPSFFLARYGLGHGDLEVLGVVHGANVR